MIFLKKTGLLFVVAIGISSQGLSMKRVLSCLRSKKVEFTESQEDLTCAIREGDAQKVFMLIECENQGEFCSETFLKKGIAPLLRSDKAKIQGLALLTVAYFIRKCGERYEVTCHGAPHFVAYDGLRAAWPFSRGWYRKPGDTWFLGAYKMCEDVDATAKVSMTILAPKAHLYFRQQKNGIFYVVLSGKSRIRIQKFRSVVNRGRVRVELKEESAADIAAFPGMLIELPALSSIKYRLKNKGGRNLVILCCSDMPSSQMELCGDIELCEDLKRQSEFEGHNFKSEK